MLDDYDAACTIRTNGAIAAFDDVLFNDPRRVTPLHKFMEENFSEWQGQSPQMRVRGSNGLASEDGSLELEPASVAANVDDDIPLDPPIRSRKPSRRVSFSDQPITLGDRDTRSATKTTSALSSASPTPTRSSLPAAQRLPPHYEVESSPLPLPALLPRVVQVQLPHRRSSRVPPPSVYPALTSSPLSVSSSPVQYVQQLQSPQQQRSASVSERRPISSAPFPRVSGSVVAATAENIAGSPKDVYSPATDSSLSRGVLFQPSVVPKPGFRAQKALHVSRSGRQRESVSAAGEPQQTVVEEQRHLSPPVRPKYVSARALSKDAPVKQAAVGQEEMYQLGISIGSMGLARRSQPFQQQMQKAPVRSTSRRQ